MVKGVVNYSDTSLGARSKDPQKYIKDAKVLEEALVADPNNSRYQFYLAAAYINANELELALKNCTKRTQMEGDPGEVFVTLLLKARLEEHFAKPHEEVVASYKKACAHTPSRAEPFFYLGSYYLATNQPSLAYDELKKAPTSFDPENIFFTESEIYDWKLPYFLAKTCLQLQKFQEMQSALQQVVKGKNVPQDVLEESVKNLAILKGMLK
jgi:tetratricopeptide (TPR) repeat protein